MKKLRRYASILAIIISVLVLLACAKTEQKEMYIKSSEFTEETREVLELFDDEVQFFDIVLDETVKSETSSMENYNVTENFRTMDCNAGIVVTLTVSDEIVE